jgi:hypothetical protein
MVQLSVTVLISGPVYNVSGFKMAMAFILFFTIQKPDWNSNCCPVHQYYKVGLVYIKNYFIYKKIQLSFTILNPDQNYKMCPAMEWFVF